MNTPVPPRQSRPLSPHLQVYKPQITSVLSIIHRLTGMGLAFSLFFFVYWLGALASSETHYKQALSFFGSWVGSSILFLISFAFYYHLTNGIRHLFWDAGHGYALETVRKTGWAVVFATLILTLSTWIFLIDAK